MEGFQDFYKTALSDGSMLAAIKLRFGNIKVYIKRCVITGGS